MQRKIFLGSLLHSDLELNMLYSFKIIKQKILVPTKYIKIVMKQWQIYDQQLNRGLKNVTATKTLTNFFPISPAMCQ